MNSQVDVFAIDLVECRSSAVLSAEARSQTVEICEAPREGHLQPGFLSIIIRQRTKPAIGWMEVECGLLVQGLQYIHGTTDYEYNSRDCMAQPGGKDILTALE